MLVAGLLMAATAACGSGVEYSVPDTHVSHGATTRPGTPTGSASASRGSAEAAGSPGTPVPSPSDTPSTAPSSAPARAVAPPAAPACTSRDLTVSEGKAAAYMRGDSMRYAAPVVLRDRSGSTCRLSGWPGLTFFGEGTIHVCTTADPPGCVSGPESTSGTRPFKVTRSRTVAPPTVTLAPGGTTSFTMSWPFCGMDLDAPYGMEVRLPGDSRPLILAPAKNAIPCENKLDVTPFGVMEPPHPGHPLG